VSQRITVAGSPRFMVIKAVMTDMGMGDDHEDFSPHVEFSSNKREKSPGCEKSS
jgi:hypothetical protein